MIQLLIEWEQRPAAQPAEIRQTDAGFRATDADLPEWFFSRPNEEGATDGERK